MLSIYAPALCITSEAKFITLDVFLFDFSFSFLWGPVNHVKHLCSLGRLPFTAAYFGAMFATLYAAMIVSISDIYLMNASQGLGNSV